LEHHFHQHPHLINITQMLLYRRNQILFILSTLISLSLPTTTTITDDDKWKTLTEWAKKHGAYIHPSI
jgi:hypothetical protein